MKLSESGAVLLPDRVQWLAPWWISGPALAGVATGLGLLTGMNATAAAGLYVLAVVASSLIGRLWGALAASILGFFCLNYFFTPPRETFAVEKAEDLVALVVFLIVAVVVSGLFSSLSAERVRASAHEEEAREAKLESAASDLRAAIFSAVTHDLKTPITSIKASVDSLLDAGKLSAGDRELLSSVSSDADRLNRLVGNVLDLARLKAGAMELNLVDADILEVLGVVLNRVRPLAEGRKIVVKTPAHVPELLLDLTQMDHVLNNLLENAIRFSPPESPIEVLVSARFQSVQVKVVDHGPGIPPAERGNVVQPFYRMTRDATIKGSGLGLAIVSSMVAAQGGTLAFDTTPGGGTTVIMTFPARRR